jgi:hypothetical protein
MPSSLKARESSAVIAAFEWRPAREISWRTKLDQGDIVSRDPIKYRQKKEKQIYKKKKATCPCFARSQMNDFKEASSKPVIQLKEGLRL